MWDWVHEQPQSSNFGFPKCRNPGISPVATHCLLASPRIVGNRNVAATLA